MERAILTRDDGNEAPIGVENEGLAPLLILTVTIAFGMISFAIGAFRLALPATELPAPFPAQNQDAETILFLLAFGVVLPLALAVVPRIVDRIASAGNRDAIPALAAIASASLAAVLILVRLVDDAGIAGALEALLVLSGAWLLAVAVVLRRAAAEPSPALLRLTAAMPALPAVAAALIVAAFVVFVDLGSIAWVPLFVALAVGAALIRYREALTSLRPGRRTGVAIDVAVVLLLVLAVPNVVVFAGEPFETSIVQFHQDFFLGPANQVIHGGEMLIDTFSQYGVASILFLAGVFQFAPAGNGTVALTEGLLSIGMFAGAYGVLRMSGVSRLLAASALALAVFALVFALLYPLGGLLQHGAIRFGMPIVVIVAAVAAVRWPRRAGAMRLLELAVLGLSSIWALEAFAYTLLTFAAIVALEVVLLPAGSRRQGLVARLAGAVAACIAAHAVFAVATLVAFGQLPEWDRYVSTLREFLTGTVGELTYDFEPWSPALPVGALYVVSVAGIVLLVRRRRDLAELHRLELVALTGTTAWGIALFSYFVNRSAEHILPYICLPAVMVGVLWLNLLLNASPPPSARTRLTSMATAGATAAVILAAAWPHAGNGFSESALAHAAPGGDSLPDALTRLWENPVLRPGAPEGVRLLDEEMPGESASLIVTDADLGVEILARAERSSELPFGDPWEDSLVPDQHYEALGASVDGLEPGRLMLIDEPALEIFESYLRDPDPEPPVAESIVPTGISALQQWVLQRIGERFELRTVASGESGLSVVELTPRQPE